MAAGESPPLENYVMAQLFLQQNNEHPGEWDEKSSHIYLSHNFGPDFSKQALRAFKGDGRVDILEEDLELGGGGAESLIHMLVTGITFSVMLMAQGFFSEIGSSTARKIIDLLKNKKTPSAIVIANKKKKVAFKVFLPQSLSAKECEEALSVIDHDLKQAKARKQKYAVYFYDKKRKALVEYEKHEW